MNGTCSDPTSGIVDRDLAISGERRLKHSGVVAISAAARAELFA